MSILVTGGTGFIGSHFVLERLEQCDEPIINAPPTSVNVSVASYSSLITYVKDRPGHDRRYAIDASKIQRELGWKPAETSETGIRKTVQWYLDNPAWVRNLTSGVYRNWVETHNAAEAAA